MVARIVSRRPLRRDDRFVLEVEEPEAVRESFDSPVDLLHTPKQLCLHFELAGSADVEVLARFFDKQGRAVSEKITVGKRMIGLCGLPEIGDGASHVLERHGVECAKRRQHV